MDFNFEKELFLENENVCLRPLTLEDLKNLLPVATEDKKLIQFSPGLIHSESHLLEYITSALQEKKSHSRYPFVIFDKTTNKYAGSTSFLNSSDKDKRIEIGATWIGNAFQKTGLNRNCKFLLLSYVFERLEFERVELKTDERNQTSRTAIEKIGGKYEGLLRSHMVMSDGYRRNTVYYSILKSEWPKLKKTVFNLF